MVFGCGSDLNKMMGHCFGSYSYLRLTNTKQKKYVYEQNDKWKKDIYNGKLIRLFLMERRIIQHPNPGPDRDNLPPPPAEGWTVARDPKNPHNIVYTSPPHPLLARGPVKIDRPAKMKRYVDKGIFNAALLDSMVFRTGTA